MLNIAIVAKDSHEELYKSLDGLQSIIKKKDNLNYQISIFYSSASKLPMPNINDFLDLNLSLTISNDNSVYSAMNFALSKIYSGHLMFLNCGDIVTGEIRNLIDYLNSPKRKESIILYNSFHKDLSKRKKGLYVSRFSPRWYFIFFGMKSEHCCFIAPINILKKFKFDERLKYAADYKLILNSLNFANRLKSEIIDNRDLILVKPEPYGISNEKSFQESIEEELFALLSSEISYFKKSLGFIYRILKLLFYYLFKILKITKIWFEKFSRFIVDSTNCFK